MNKIIKTFIPSILIFILAYIGRHNKDLILTEIYILFPIIYIINGIINKKAELLVSSILLSLAFLIPVNIWFNMGSCLDLVIIYNIISFIAYLAKNKIKK